MKISSLNLECYVLAIKEFTHCTNSLISGSITKEYYTTFPIGFKIFPITISYPYTVKVFKFYLSNSNKYTQ